MHFSPCPTQLILLYLITLVSANNYEAHYATFILLLHPSYLSTLNLYIILGKSSIYSIIKEVSEHRQPCVVYQKMSVKHVVRCAVQGNVAQISRVQMAGKC
jgi:hypothetical protein